MIRLTIAYDQERRPLPRRVLISLVYRLHGGTFVANSRGSKRKLQESLGIGGDRIEVVYNCVDVDAIRAMAAREPEHGISESVEAGFLLFVGRLSRQKRIDVLIRAFSRVAERVDVDLVVLGDGPLAQELSRLVADLGLDGRVHMPGFAVNPYAYMSRAAALVLTSDYEGMPTVLIEALACGCPVVSTDCPSGPREILEDGTWGELVPTGDVGAVAEAMERTIRDPLPEDRLRARARDFTVERTAGGYAEILARGRS